MTHFAGSYRTLYVAIVQAFSDERTYHFCRHRLGEKMADLAQAPDV